MAVDIHHLNLEEEEHQFDESESTYIYDVEQSIKMNGGI
jgi:hypothetical protein